MLRDEVLKGYAQQSRLHEGDTRARPANDTVERDPRRARNLRLWQVGVLLVAVRRSGTC